MKKVEILEDFTGYPHERKEGSGDEAKVYSLRQRFSKGQVVDVPIKFADMIIEKGHAKLAPDDGEKHAHAKESRK